MAKRIIGFGNAHNTAGLGFADNDFLDEYKFRGTKDDAENEQSKVSYEKRSGDDCNLIEELKPKLVVVSGPSGVGKGPIINWVKKLYFPNLCQVKVQKTRTERHDGTEDDLIIDDRKGDYYTINCRGTEQRLYWDDLDDALKTHDIVLLETYHTAIETLERKYSDSKEFISVFISPLDAKEINDLAKRRIFLEDYLPKIMMDCLIKRAENQGKKITNSLIYELEKRAAGSVNEMNCARKYKYVIPNHCPESDVRWKMPVLIGEPGKVVDSLRDIINQSSNAFAYKGQNYVAI